MTFLYEQRKSLEKGGQEKSFSSYRRRALKVAVVREELVELTDDPLVAIVLNQLLYWTERVKDFDLLLEEERRDNPECNVSPRYGWIYKTADELNEETMLRVSRPTIRKYLKILVEKGWVDERSNPHNNWDKTTQYRVNLRKLQKDLLALGYALPGYPLFPTTEDPKERDVPKEYSDKLDLSVEDKNFKPSYENLLTSKENSNEFPRESFLTSGKNLSSEVKNFLNPIKTFLSKEKNLTPYTYTEITTETTNREHTHRTRAREENEKSFFADVLEIWNTSLSQNIHLTDERRRGIHSLFPLYFENDLEQWKKFCERVKASPFLMGQGTRKWHVTLDWILTEENLLKVLEGNFDDSEKLQTQKEAQVQASKNAEKNEILESIQDATWKEWCDALVDLKAHEKNPLSFYVLKDITNARFAEFDGRLVWLESPDPKVLRRIEELRLSLLTIAQRTFPDARNIRTRLAEESNDLFSLALQSPFQKGEPHHE